VLSRNAKVDAIRRVPLFAGCSAGDLEQIAAVADELRFDAGRTLIEQGAVGREFILVLEGDVEVTRDGEQVPLKGEAYFGEMALVSGEPRNATVTTTSPVRALVITQRAFERLLRDAPEIQTKIMATVDERSAADEL
jgi:CRP/FNR family transcriptional regulator, cyclic AMP receptor protein